jgi:hypothetical protein
MSRRPTVVRVAGSVVLAGAMLMASTPGSAAAGGAQLAAAGPYRVKDLRALSGPSPFPAGCPGAVNDGEKVTGGEIEPAITVNPARPQNIVGVWQQDFGFGARTDLIGASFDGGRRWIHAMIPGLTVCTGGTADFASDPWISAGVDGTVYFAGSAGSAASEPPPLAVITSRSRDGGRSWAPPTALTPLDPNLDTPAITASPVLPGHAYLSWASWDHLYNFPLNSALRFSRSTDGGASWSPQVVIDQPGPTALDVAGRILVLPDRARQRREPGPGVLLAVFARADLATGVGGLFAARSLDEGQTWLPAVQIGSQPVATYFDPDSGLELPNAGFPSAAVAPDGTAYVAFEAPRSASSGAIGVARSRDGGRTWTQATPAGVGAFAFEPAIAVDSHGTVGLSFYDFRNDRLGDASLTADSWFVHSTDRGASWRETHLAGPFDLRGAPFAETGHALGEYQGMTALPGRGFGVILTLARPLARDGTTDIFFARIGPG